MDDYYGVTTIHPIGLLALLILGLFMIRAEKTKALIPVVILACFISPAQRIVIGGMDFNFIRMMMIFGWIRVILRNEHIGFKFALGDKLMICWAMSKIVLYTIQQHGAMSATIYQLGTSFEALSTYFLTRILVRSIEDVKDIIKVILAVSFPIAVLFLIESTTGRNIFSFLGGVGEYSIVREGRVRATGAFAHPILAGCFFASVLPMILALVLKDKKLNLRPFFGFMCILAIIFLCASSTPLIGIMLAFISMLFFPLRFKMKNVQLFALMVLIGLDIVMKAPLWHLLSRIDVAGGSTGYYRYLLIDKAIANFSDWALVGIPSTGVWSDVGGENMSDIVNQYIFEGAEGGLLTMVLFMSVIIVGLGIIGRILKRRDLPSNDELFIWSLGSSLFSQSMMFLVVSYFGQIVMLWNLLLGVIITMGVIYRDPEKEPVPVRLGEAVLGQLA